MNLNSVANAATGITRGVLAPIKIATKFASRTIDALMKSLSHKFGAHSHQPKGNESYCQEAPDVKEVARTRNDVMERMKNSNTQFSKQLNQHGDNEKEPEELYPEGFRVSYSDDEEVDEELLMPEEVDKARPQQEEGESPCYSKKEADDFSKQDHFLEFGQMDDLIRKEGENFEETHYVTVK